MNKTEKQSGFSQKTKNRLDLGKMGKLPVELGQNRLTISVQGYYNI